MIRNDGKSVLKIKSLQDITQEAQAALYRAQAEKCLADTSQNENS